MGVYCILCNCVLGEMTVCIVILLHYIYGTCFGPRDGFAEPLSLGRFKQVIIVHWPGSAVILF